MNLFFIGGLILVRDPRTTTLPRLSLQLIEIMQRSLLVADAKGHFRDGMSHFRDVKTVHFSTNQLTHFQFLDGANFQPDEIFHTAPTNTYDLAHSTPGQGVPLETTTRGPIFDPVEIESPRQSRDASGLPWHVISLLIRF